jgi:carbonic anhydrase
MRLDPRQLGLVPGKTGAPEQRPFAAIVGCADARVPIELIFSEGPNDLFVIRIAGNGLGSDVLGSLSYASDHLGDSLKAIVVLGHSGCGAISAAVDVFLRPELFLPLAAKEDLRGILDRSFVIIQPSAHALRETLGPEIVTRPGYRAGLIETAVVMNAVLGAYTIQQGLAAQGEKRFAALYGVYLLQTRQIWAPAPGGSDWYHLARANRSRRLPCDRPRRCQLRQDRLGAERRGRLKREFAAHHPRRARIEKMSGPLLKFYICKADTF